MKYKILIIVIMAISCKKNQVINFCSQPDVLKCETEYCQKYNQTDTVSFQVNLSEYTGDELVIAGDLEPMFTGTATSTSANKLVDTGANFTALPYSIIGWTVKNTTDNTYALITASTTNDQNTLSLSADIMASGETYEILPFATSLGLLTYDETNGYWERSGASTVDYLTQPNILQAGHYYKVTFDLTSVSGATAGVSRDDVGDVVVSYNESGTYTTYFKSTSANLYIATTGEMAIDNISVELMSSVLVVVLDCDGNEVFYDEEDELGLVTYFQGQAGKGEAQVNILWSSLGLDDGNYRVCIKDKANFANNLFINGEFDYILGGTSDNPYVINTLTDTQGKFVTAGIPVGASVHNQPNDFEGVVVSVDSETQLTLDDDAFPFGSGDSYWSSMWKVTNNTPGNGFLPYYPLYGRLLHFSGVSGVDTLEAASLTIDPLKSYVLRYWITDESALFGSYQVDGTIKYDTATTSGNQLAVLSGGVNEVEINNLAITRLYIESNEQGVYGIEYLRLYEVPECVGEAKCVSLGTHTGTALLTWTNDENYQLSSTDYIDYENFSYTQKLRINCRFGEPSFNKEQENFTYSNGIREKIYSQSTEVVKLYTEHLPPYIHRALAVGLEHDTFTVDGLEYVCEEESYVPTYRKSNSLAPVIVELTPADQRNENSKC